MASALDNPCPGGLHVSCSAFLPSCATLLPMQQRTPSPGRPLSALSIAFAACLAGHVPAIGAQVNAPQPIDFTAADFAEASILADAAQIAAERDRYERMTVPVRINEAGPFRFMIDTGAQATILSRSVAQTLALEPAGQAMLIATGSSNIVDLVWLDGLSFAEREFNGVQAALLERRNMGADGILGLDSLQGMRVLLDFKEDRMSVADADTARETAGYEIVVRARRKLGQMIITDARLDGVKTVIIIDTGAQSSTGNRALQARLRNSNQARLSATDVHGTEFFSELGYARDVRIGSLTIRNVAIGFTDSPAFGALDLQERPALILGLNALHAFDRIAIDFERRRIMFDLPRDTPVRYEAQDARPTR